MLHIFLSVVEAHLRAKSPGGSARARFGSASLLHRFGAALNRHVHYHCCIIDGVSDYGLRLVAKRGYSCVV
jgi:hypothetical protein